MSDEKPKKDESAKPSGARIDVSGDGAIGTAGNVNKSILASENAGNITQVEVPINIYQGTATQPALPALTLHQLPNDLADFTGRNREIKDLLKVLEKGNGRVVISAINGMGGIGKTTLAVHVAHQLMEHYPDAQIIVDMQGTTQPLAPVEAMLRVIRAFQPEISAADDINQIATVYRDTLAGKHVLILLDNAADAAQVRLLAPPASCVLIVTSRRRIAIEGAQPFDLNALSEKDARDLLREIIGKRRTTNAQLDRIAELCGRLPLALRIAATFLTVRRDWTVDEYIEALSDERQRLVHLRQDDLDVEATLQLSRRQLEQEDATLALRWRQLAVFPAAFNRLAAAAVWEVTIEAARDGLSKLFERGLVLYNEETMRYRLHDLVRLFVTTQLDDVTRSVAQQRHAAHYCDELNKADTFYRQGGESIKQGLALFDLEWRNIQAGQAWAAAYAAADNQAAKLCNRYPVDGWYLLDLRQHPRERLNWSNCSLIVARQMKQQWYEAEALRNLGLAYAALGETRQAIELYEQHLAVAREISDRHSEGGALNNMGLAYAELGETRRAIEYHGQQLVIMREIGDRRGEGNALFNTSLALDTLGERERAIPLAEAALKIYEQIESPSAKIVRKALTLWRGQPPESSES